jgi:hypothetical protein
VFEHVRRIGDVDRGVGEGKVDATAEHARADLRPAPVQAHLAHVAVE